MASILPGCSGQSDAKSLLRVAERPNPREIGAACPRRYAAFLQLYPQPDMAQMEISQA